MASYIQGRLQNYKIALLNLKQYILFLFQFFNMWLSLGGSMLCVVLMFVISWWTALVTLAAILALYLIVSYQKPGKLY